MKTTRIFALWAAGVSLCVFCTAMKQPEVKAHARLEAISSASAIAAGVPFTVALSFEIDPDWHLYWKDPGDSGMPPKVKWTLPEGYSAGELRFPTPSVLKTPAGTNYIYENRVTLLLTITPPKTFETGKTATFSGAVNWLECDAERCLPAKQTVRLSVVTAEQAEPNHTERFTEWEAAVKAGETFKPDKSE